MIGMAQVRRHRRHVGGVAADHALSSASNFLAAVVALRAGGADGFAAAGICLVLVRVAVAIVRSYAVEATVVADPTATTVTGRDLTGTAAAATTSGAVLAAAALLYLWAFGVHLDVGLLVLVTVGLVTMGQGEAVRSLLLLRRQYSWALWYDGVWLAMFLATVPWLLGGAAPGTVLAVWSLTGAVALVGTGPILRRLVVAPIGSDALVPAPLLSPRRRAGLAAETAMDRASNQLSIAVIASVASPALATGITGARTVLSPLNPLLFALFNLVLPISAGVTDERRRRVVGIVVVAAPLAVLVAAGLVVALPAAVVEAVVGAAWTNARPVFVPVALLFAAAIVRQLVLAVARGASLVRTARTARYAASIATFAPCLIALAGQVEAALWLVAACSLVGAVLVGRRVAAALQQRELVSC